MSNAIKAKERTAELIKHSSIIDPRKESDTFKLWESYRDQATLWRAIALLQIPATIIALIFALVLWQTRSVTLNVPRKPEPGIYVARDIPDTEFIDVATNFVNLVASYQYSVAERQFEKAREMLIEPALSQFQKDMLGSELKTIRQINRSQYFFADPTKTLLERSDRNITVTLRGDRQKIVSGESPLEKLEFKVTMSLIPRNNLNPYGIMISGFDFYLLEKR